MNQNVAGTDEMQSKALFSPYVNLARSWVKLLLLNTTLLAQRLRCPACGVQY